MIALHMAMSRTSDSKLPRTGAALGDPELASSRRSAMTVVTRASWASEAPRMQ